MPSPLRITLLLRDGLSFGSQPGLTPRYLTSQFCFLLLEKKCADGSYMVVLWPVPVYR